MNTSRFIPLSSPQQMLPLSTPVEPRMMRLPSAAKPVFKLGPSFKPLHGDPGLPAGDRDPVRQAAEDLVSLSLLQPLLKQAQDDPFRSDLFHGGQGEEMFTQQLNEELAKRMSGAMNNPVVDAIYRQFTAHSQASEVDRHG